MKIILNDEIETNQDISWKRREVLKRYKILYLSYRYPYLMSFTVTGFLFHQVFIADLKSWTMTEFGSKFYFLCNIVEQLDRINHIRYYW